MTETTKRRGKETREDIFAAALDLFSQRGFEAVTIRELAAAVGIKESSIYNHYTSKDEILEHVFQFFVDNVHSAPPALEETRELLGYQSPEEYLKHQVMLVGHKYGDKLDKAARVIYGEKHRNARAGELFLAAVIQKPAAYYAKIFALMAELGLVGVVDFEHYGEQYNYVLAALAEEYALVKGAGGSVAPVVKKMLRNAEFFARLLELPQQGNH